MRAPAVWAAAATLFVVLATANGGGYRYGTSDQAFYIPAVVRALDPAAFPRDAALVDAQARLILTDEVLAGMAHATSLPLPTLFLLAYVLALVLLAIAAAAIGRALYRTPWMIVALGAALTLRHRIPRTSVNSIEPYFHPRLFAFAFGALAVAALLHRRRWASIGLVAASALVHVTTALWFAVLVGVALAVLDRTWRRVALAGAVLAGAVGAWAVAAGPLRASLTRMDAVWLDAVSGKDSLFATDWPAWAWLANLAGLAVLWWACRRRRLEGRATAEDIALLWGATALVLVFLVTLPAVAARVALPVQFQISRVFWLVDFLAIVYVLGTIRGPRAALAVAVVLTLVSASRAVYVLTIERPERALFAVTLGDSPWERTMRWLNAQATDAHVLADPGHAWKYGTSVRVSAGRDVFVEDVKDSAIAIYSRDVAVRYLERMRALGDFGALTAADARALARRYALDYLVTEAELSLPLAYRNDRFRVYELD